MNNIINQPIFFERNRVFRVYKGGKLFSKIYKDKAVDNNMPEEWICSTVAALNDGGKAEDGLSVVRGTNITFDKLIESYPEELLGGRKKLGVLVKILDSAVRLPIQAHPDKEFSKKYFNSSYGKTEMWLVLATRKGAHIFLGFNHAVTKQEFIDTIEKTEKEKDIMVPLLSKIEVKTGEVFLIPATLVHAIGYGCLILEVQEPTDFTVQPEAWCGDYRLSYYEKYLGLPMDTAIDCFNLGLTSDKAILMSKCTPKIIYKTESYFYESLITYKDTPCFCVNRLTINKKTEINLLNKPAIYIIIKGKGILNANGNIIELKKGDYFFLPYCVKECVLYSENIIIIECLPPKTT
jgi:Phosphomannose isomerase